MIIWMLSTLGLAFVVSLVFGKQYIPLLKNHGFIQPLKDEVNQTVYQASNKQN